MDQNLPRLYKDYGGYSNWRALPSDIDGLKPVERRVLFSAYKIARGKFVKSRQVDAYTIGHFHPHGGTYGTIVQLVKQGILIGQGNFGSNVGVEPVGPAADRYTECQMNPKTVDLAFKYIEQVPWVDTELSDKEPLFLPTMFPFCLAGTEYTQGIGFGFKTFIPCYSTKDLYQRLLFLLGIRKRKPIIRPMTDCNILSDDSVLEKLLTTGKAKIEVEGIIEIDKLKNIAILKSWPPGKRFESFLNKFSKELSDGTIGFTDLSVTSTNIIFQVLRERNRDKIFEQFIKKLIDSVKGSISFEVVVVDSNRNVLTKSVDNMLLDTYKMFSQANENMLNDEIKKLDQVIIEYKMLEKIRPVLASGISSKLESDNILKLIEETTGVSKNISKELISKYRISKLLSLDTDTTDLNNKKQEICNTKNEITKFILEQYNRF